MCISQKAAGVDAPTNIRNQAMPDSTRHNLLHHDFCIDNDNFGEKNYRNSGESIREEPSDLPDMSFT